jgi:hypothetical protein
MKEGLLLLNSIIKTMFEAISEETVIIVMGDHGHDVIIN